MSICYIAIHYMNERQNIIKNVVADIGGTNFRLAMVDEQYTLSDIHVEKVSNYESFTQGLTAYIEQKNIQINHLALAIAGPVVSHHISMTNSHWQFNIADIVNTFSLSSLHVINDLTALALAVPHLPQQSLKQLGTQKPVPQHNIAVIGIGTGLGVSGLIHLHSGNFLPIQSEGGHIHLAALSSEEAEILDILRLNEDIVSAETLLSGTGIVRIYNALMQMNGGTEFVYSSSEISAKAFNKECGVAQKTLKIFATLLARFSSDCALMFGTKGGVYIGGGVTAKIAKCFAEEQFRDTFINSEFASYLAEIPTYLILDEYAGLKGITSLFGNNYEGIGVKHVS